MRSSRLPLTLFLLSCVLPLAPAWSQEDAGGPPVRGSFIEDQAARKLMLAGDTRYDADEVRKAVEIWESVIERYPRSRVRFEAHMRLGNYFLERDRSYDRARVHFDVVASDENRDEDQRAEATLKLGECFYHARNFGKCFQVLRDVIEKYPASPQVNQAYYFIGLGHFQLGHYSRAISALEKVGTTLSAEDKGAEKLEAGKRLFIRIEDADLAVLEPGETVEVEVASTSGDKERVICHPVGRNVRLVLGSISSKLGRPNVGNGELEVKGGDKVNVTYVDRHTAEKKLNQPVGHEITVVGDAKVAIMDGAFSETLNGVVLGKGINLQVDDADIDSTDEADTLKAIVEVYRRKTDEEIEAELAKAAAAVDTDAPSLDSLDEPALPEIDRYKSIDRIEITLTEAKLAPPEDALKIAPAPADEAPAEAAQPEAAQPAAADAPAEGDQPATPAEQPAEGEAPAEAPAAKPAVVDNSTHSGIFRAVVAVVTAEEPIADDDLLQAVSGDLIRLTYVDELHTGDGINQIKAEARCLEGNIGGVRVTRAVISDQELRIQTKLKTASALTNIGNRYKEFGLKVNADQKYDEALAVCDEIMDEARKLGGRLLELTYVQFWQIYFEKDELNLAAAMCQRLQREFPNSGFVDDALLQLADVARKQGDSNRAISIYSRLVAIKTSQLRGEAQFGIAQTYEAMADAAADASKAQMSDRAFQEYKKVYDGFPESGRVGEAVAKMADYYYQQKDYSRAIDTFETVLSNHPDAKFLDVILFNYGRCLYRMGRRGEARQRFEQVISEFPESPLAADSKKISDALAKAGF